MAPLENVDQPWLSLNGLSGSMMIGLSSGLLLLTVMVIFACTCCQRSPSSRDGPRRLALTEKKVHSWRKSHRSSDASPVSMPSWTSKSSSSASYSPMVQAERVAVSFALTWYRATKCVMKMEKGYSNLVTSPFAVQIAFGLWYLGLKEKLQKVTLNQLFPGCVNDADEKVVLRTMMNSTKWWRRKSIHCANRLCAPACRLFSSHYRKHISTIFGGNQFLPVDFVNYAAALIDATNRWTTTVTKGRIQLMQSLEEHGTTGLLLVSAIFVDGKQLLLNPFNRLLTGRAEPFYPDMHTRVICDFLWQSKEMGYYEDEMCQVVRMPYDGDTEMGLYIFLPRKRFGLEELEAKLTTDYVLDRLNACCRSTREVELILPKITVGTEMQHGKMLEALTEMKFTTMELFEAKKKPQSQDECSFGKMVLTPKKAVEKEEMAVKLQISRSVWIAQMVHKTVFELEDSVVDEGSIHSSRSFHSARSTSARSVSTRPGESIRKGTVSARVKAEHPFLFLLAIDVPKIPVVFGRFTGL